MIVFSVGKRDPGGISPEWMLFSKRATRLSASDAALVVINPHSHLDTDDRTWTAYSQIHLKIGRSESTIRRQVSADLGPLPRSHADPI